MDPFCHSHDEITYWFHFLVRSFLSESSWRSFSLYQSIDIRFNQRRIMIPDLRWCSVISRRIRNDWMNYSRNLICYITLLVPVISISLMSWVKVLRWKKSSTEYDVLISFMIVRIFFWYKYIISIFETLSHWFDIIPYAIFWTCYALLSNQWGCSWSEWESVSTTHHPFVIVWTHQLCSVERRDHDLLQNLFLL